MSEADIINSILRVKYGVTPDGKPHFRLVWSDSQFEIRRGTFNEFYGDIPLRSHEGVKEVPKYNYIRERWILEKWCPSWMLQNSEILNHNNFEPLYVFEDKDRNYLPLSQKVCEFIIWNVLNPNMDRGQKKQYIEDKLARELKEEVAYFEDMMEDKDNFLRFQLREGEAILNPGIASKG